MAPTVSAPAWFLVFIAFSAFFALLPPLWGSSFNSILKFSGFYLNHKSAQR